MLHEVVCLRASRHFANGTCILAWLLFPCLLLLTIQNCRAIFHIKYTLPSIPFAALLMIGVEFSRSELKIFVFKCSSDLTMFSYFGDFSLFFMLEDFFQPHL